MSCESTRGTWGQPCPDCGATLPAPRAWQGWRSERIDPGQSERARQSSTASYYSKTKRAEYAARVASFFDPDAAMSTQGEVQL